MALSFPLFLHELITNANGALTKKLAITTAEMTSNAWLESEGIISTRTTPTPTSMATALVVMKNMAAICMRIDMTAHDP
jgi:hypothetical protein